MSEINPLKPEGPKPAKKVPSTPPPAEEGKKPAEVAKPSAAAEAMAKGMVERMDAHSIAIRLASIAAEARKRELSFEEIIEKVILETGITNPEAALEEANKKIQKEIETVLEEIKSNRELMDEEEAWQEFASVLESRLSEGQVQDLFKALQDAVFGLQA